MDFQAVYNSVRLCGHRWTLEIMTALQVRPMRFTDLLQTITPTPHAKSLNDALRRLQDQGLVSHSGGGDGSLYELTPAGRHLLPLVMDFAQNLKHWGELYRDTLPHPSGTSSD